MNIQKVFSTVWNFILLLSLLIDIIIIINNIACRNPPEAYARPVFAAVCISFALVVNLLDFENK